MTDYRISVKVRNNIILDKIEKTGYSVPKFCKKFGLSYPRILDIIRFRKSPFDRKLGDFTDKFNHHILKLSKILKCLPEDLFTEKQLRLILDKNKKEVIIKESEMEYIINAPHNLCPSPEGIAISEEVSLGIKQALQTLTPREQKIIEMRFTQELTYKNCGIIFNVSTERARQIEGKALRKLRSPNRAALIPID